MNNNHDILNKIPHEQIQSQFVRADERFDVFKLGMYRVEKSVLDFMTCEKNEAVDEIVELVKLEPNSYYKPHYHKRSSAIIYMIFGEGHVILGENDMPYFPGMRLDIPQETPHGFKTDCETFFLSIQTPPIRNDQTGEVDLYYVEE